MRLWLLISSFVGILVPRIAAQNAPGSSASPHGALNLACTACHTADSWRPARISREFRHADYGFALTDAHGGVTCTSCHTSLEFSKVAKTCAACHRDVHQGELGLNCSQCHNTRDFRDRAPQMQAHALTRFPLEGAHRAVECSSCHTSRAGSSLVFRGAPTDCISCHRADFDRTTRPNHPAAGFPTDCTGCHTNASWARESFDHNTTQFQLTGAHQAVTCQQCHSDGVFKGKPTTCVSCHQATYNATTTPPHQAAAFSTECVTCHNTARWPGAGFYHSTTRFVLTGAHQATTCQACHNDGVYHNKPMTCVSCHQARYTATTNPPHQAAGFPADCTTCHTTTTWTGAPFNHSNSRFALTGAHQATSCAACHSDGVYHNKPTTCVSCHMTRYTATATPPHQSSGIPTTCEGCHNTATWGEGGFNHANTRFPLSGAHLATTCTACHTGGTYRGTPMTCVGCHQTGYNATANPPHQAAGFSTDCTTCHNTATWTGAAFNHSTTRFALTGAHQAAACTQCHVNGVYRGTAMTCVACHQANYSATTNPSHQSAGFPTDCTSCHTTTTWTGASFNHSTFPLTGGHQAATCQQCHLNGVYRGTPTTCVACHQANYNATTNPAHQSAGFPTDCTSCHNTVTWAGATFTHSSFPLTGAHQAASCQQCHVNGVYRGTPTTCLACHQASYNATTNPPHQSAGFPTDCTTCHSTVTWTGATFNHNTTQFPLTGAHLATTCQACHAGGVYRGLATTCVSCHQTQYNGTTNPPHQAAGFPNTCATCHTTTTWTGGTFNHSTTQFPLTGAHITTSCQACHSSGVYNNLATTCVSCHQTDYNGTTNPNHRTAGFPTDCTSCHTTTRWDGATFNHDGLWFRIYSGHHRGRWTTCAQCHDNPASFTQFTCLTCHGQSQTNSQHQGRAGYSYNSQACYSCHRNS